MAERPKVGVGVIIRRQGKVLADIRKGAHGAGTWCFPGGHLEFGEEVEECARRETMEETGVTIRNIRHAPWTNDIYEGIDKGRHYVTLFVLCDWDSGEPRVMEPDRFEKWEWLEWDDLPDNMFLPNINLKKLGYNPFQ
ncbi:NUDIX domain-containing protein [Candidatus Woesearchaeota archaeon]|nr:NUDIX domain-containing protein [Candidatus Woesearchaeota archaeon]